MPAHFLDLQGASVLKTPAFARARRVVPQLVANFALGLMYGPPGTGKTFAAERAHEYLDVEVRRMVFPQSPTPRAIAHALYLDMAGLDHTGTKAEIERDLIGHLEQEPRLLEIDEADRLTYDGVEYIRHLHDHPTTKLAVLLIGGEHCLTLIKRYPALESRLYRRVPFHPLSYGAVLETMPKLHPLLATATRDVISEVDDAFAQGILRNWASFTNTALELVAEHGLPPELSPELAEAAIDLIAPVDGMQCEDPDEGAE